MAEFSFVHCSDIHLLSLGGVSPHRFLNKRITGGVNLLFKRRKGHDGRLFDQIVEHAKRLQVDRLVVTGDVTNLALESEFELVRSKLDGAGLPVTVIPGNHDTYTRGSAKKKRFESFMSHHMQGERIDAAEYPFAFVHDEHTALIGVSTAIPTRPMSAVGRVGPAQLGRLDRMLSDLGARGLVRIVLIHHPVAEGVAHDGHQLLDIGPFGDVIKRCGAELVLHGHEHVHLEYELQGPDGPVPVHGIASGTSKSVRPGREAAFSVYRVRGREIERELWCWDGADFAAQAA